MQPHQQRVVDEKNELHTKVKALSQFIGYNPLFDSIPPDEQERMKLQNDIMWQYYEVLEDRIKNFK